MGFYLELYAFGAVPVRKKDEILDCWAGFIVFPVFPWHFYFMRGHSLVELTEHMTVLLISSYIVCRAIHICTAAFIVLIVYR